MVEVAEKGEEGVEVGEGRLDGDESVEDEVAAGVEDLAGLVGVAREWKECELQVGLLIVVALGQGGGESDEEFEVWLGF